MSAVLPDGTPWVMRVRMPEKGEFLVRCARNPKLSPNARRVVVALAYGEDEGVVVDAAPYDAARHGPRLPGFQFVRPFSAADEAVRAGNAALAEEMAAAFACAMRAAVPDFRVARARLSLGRGQLFVHYACERKRPDVTAAAAEVKRRWKASVSAWQVGPRDEVGLLGALGPCGRACCCATWQTRYPAAPATAAGTNAAPPANGICGRPRCCRCFED